MIFFVAVMKTQAIHSTNTFSFHLHALPFTMEHATSMTSSRTALLPSVRAQTHMVSTRGICGGRRKQVSSLLSRAVYGEDMSCDPDTYVALGLSTCFEKTDGGKLEEKDVIEPIAAGSLECLVNGADTSFKFVTASTLEEALSRDYSTLPEDFSNGVFCENYAFRCAAAARTWTRSHAQDNLMDIVPLGQVKSDFNYNLDSKRVINFENIVNDDDNIKQDISIDVYGRKKDEQYAEALKKEAKEAEAATAGDEEDDDEEEEEEDSLDSLLLG